MHVHGLARGLWVALSQVFAGASYRALSRWLVCSLLSGLKPRARDYGCESAYWDASTSLLALLWGVFAFWAFPLPNELWSWLVKLLRCDFHHPPLTLTGVTLNPRVTCGELAWLQSCISISGTVVCLFIYLHVLCYLSVMFGFLHKDFPCL